MVNQIHALLFDIHGNLPALDAVLSDAREAGAERFVLGGDFALFGAYPSETVSRLKELEAVWVRGNGERWTANPSEAPDLDVVQRSIQVCRDLLGVRAVEELEALPENCEYNDAVICHASPKSDLITFLPDGTEPYEELVEGIDARMIIFGHSHIQFKREADGKLLINPGSVGMPFDGDPRAAYALWSEGMKFEFRRVVYDNVGYVLTVKDRLRPLVGDSIETVIQRLEKSTFVY